MAYWLYNMGLAIPVSTNRLLNERKVQPLSELTTTEQTGDVTTKAVKYKVPGYTDENASQPHTVYLAEHIMSTPVVTLFDTMNVATAQQMFAKHRFRHFPVVDESNQMLGVISDRDMWTKALNQPSKTLDHGMSKPVLSAGVKTNIREICHVMFNHHIGALPIIAENGELAGMIPRRDILGAMIKHGPVQLWI
ncbi:MAG: CBS domain-containing protein [Algicola sp.]|nr:CBS domain-containing protein [Algicola sp.]